MSLRYSIGVFRLQNDGHYNIYRKFAHKKKCAIHPGHRICVGKNIFYLFKYLGIGVGNQDYCLIKEHTQISMKVKIRIFALIETVGETDDCQNFVYNNLIIILRKNAFKFNLDNSTTFYHTFA